MSENVEKKPGFDKRITPEILIQLKKRMAEFPKDTAHATRGAALATEFPMFSERTLVDYSRLTNGICDEVFQMHLDGKISLTSLSEFVVWDDKVQKFMANEYVEKKLTPSLLRIIKQLKREHDMGWDEAIGRATGTIPMDKPRKETRKNLDQILTDIADKGARWRALVDMAIEMVGDEEAAAGVHMALFEKVSILRELIGNQYDMVNGRFNRYMGLIKKRLVKNLAQDPEVIRDMSGEDTGATPGDMIDAEARVVDKPSHETKETP